MVFCFTRYDWTSILFYQKKTKIDIRFLFYILSKYFFYFEIACMNTKTKNILMTIFLLGLFGILLKTTSKLDYIQIGITLLLARIVFKSATQKRLIRYG